MSSDSKLPAIRPETSLAMQQTEALTAPSRAIVERAEVAGVAIGPAMGSLIKRPIAGLALIVYEQMQGKPKLIRQDTALLHPSGSLVIDPERDSVEALKATMFQGIQQMRERIATFMAKKGMAPSKDAADPEIERVMREAIAEAAEWLKDPGKLVNKVQIARAKAAAQSEFPNLPLIGNGGQSGGALGR